MQTRPKRAMRPKAEERVFVCGLRSFTPHNSQESGRRGSNPRRSAWKADALPLSYARSGSENIACPRRCAALRSATVRRLERDRARPCARCAPTKYRYDPRPLSTSRHRSSGGRRSARNGVTLLISSHGRPLLVAARRCSSSFCVWLCSFS